MNNDVVLRNDPSEEPWIVVLVELRGSKVLSAQTWGPFDTNGEGKKWVEQNGVLHLDPWGTETSRKVFNVVRLGDRNIP